MRLTSEQIGFARRQFERWLTLKEQHERDWSQRDAVIADDGEPAYVNRGERRYGDGELTRLNADIGHSALLTWLLEGNEPLPDPPPCRHAYPVYPR